MRSSVKMVATGAIGGLAAIVVAGSGAFACTVNADVAVQEWGADGLPYTPEKPKVRAGTEMEISVKHFYEDRVTIVNWIDAYTGQTQELTRVTGGAGIVKFRIPSNAYNTRHDKPYILQALQTPGYSRSQEVHLDGGLEPPTALLAPPIKPIDEAPPASPLTPATDIGVVIETPGSQVAAAAPVSGGTSQAAAVAAVDGTPPSDQSTSTAAINPIQPSPAPVPVGPPTPLEDVAPPAGELWSGLRADAAGNLLETVNGTTPPSGGVPAGGVALLGTGILSLAGVAFEATRRRLVLAKATRRR